MKDIDIPHPTGSSHIRTQSLDDVRKHGKNTSHRRVAAVVAVLATLGLVFLAFHHAKAAEPATPPRKVMTDKEAAEFDRQTERLACASLALGRVKVDAPKKQLAAHCKHYSI